MYDSSWFNALYLFYLRIFLRGALRAQQSRARSAETYHDVQQVCRLRFTESEQEILQRLQDFRRDLAQSNRTVTVQDHGAGTFSASFSPQKTPEKPQERRVADIYRHSATDHPWACVLFRLVRQLRPQRVLELGTNLGVAAAYLQAALNLNDEGGMLTSIEGSPEIAHLAQENIAHYIGGDVDLHIGLFHEVLPQILNKNKPFDLVFIDGHHEETATVQYFEQIRPYLSDKACVVFDDLTPGFTTVRAAWQRICAETPSASAFDFVKWGLLIL